MPLATTGVRCQYHVRREPCVRVRAVDGGAPPHITPLLYEYGEFDLFRCLDQSLRTASQDGGRFRRTSTASNTDGSLVW